MLVGVWVALSGGRVDVGVGLGGVLGDIYSVPCG